MIDTPNEIEACFEESNYYYKYSVIFIDESPDAEAPYRGVKGVIYARSINEATDKISEYYGPDNIVDLHITEKDHVCCELSDIGMKYDYETDSYVEVE